MKKSVKLGKGDKKEMGEGEKLIERLRKRKGLSIEGISAGCGLGVQSYYRVRGGSRELSFSEGLRGLRSMGYRVLVVEEVLEA